MVLLKAMPCARFKCRSPLRVRPPGPRSPCREACPMGRQIKSERSEIQVMGWAA